MNSGSANTGSANTGSANTGSAPRERDYGQNPAADTLMAATRRLMLAATTAGGSDQIALDSAARLDEISAALEACSTERMRRVPFTPEERSTILAGAPWRMFPYNALGIPQNIIVRAGEARSELVLQAVHEGPPGMLHGGFGAALLDAVLGVLVMTEVTAAVTAELTLRFHHPTPIGATVLIGARIAEVHPRSIFAEGEITLNGVTTLSARGRFVPLAMPQTAAPV